MNNKKQCPECNENLEPWDVVWPKGAGDLFKPWLVLETGDLIALFLAIILGLSSSIFAIVISTVIIIYLTIKISRERTIYACSSCKRKYSGPSLKPFQWSDYS